MAWEYGSYFIGIIVGLILARIIYAIQQWRE